MRGICADKKNDLKALFQFICRISICIWIVNFSYAVARPNTPIQTNNRCIGDISSIDHIVIHETKPIVGFLYLSYSV